MGETESQDCIIKLSTGRKGALARREEGDLKEGTVELRTEKHKVSPLRGRVILADGTESAKV